MKQSFLITIGLVLAFSAGYYFNIFFEKEKVEESVEKEVQTTTTTTTTDTNFKVSGIAGVFFKSNNPGELNKWYQENLGLPKGPYGSRYEWQENHGDSTRMGSLQWSTMSDKGNYFLPSTKDFMINYRVENLDKLVAQLQKDSIPLLDTIAIYPYGKFVHLLDIEGNKIELFEPIYTYKPE